MYENSNELYHHGVKGMKWGVHRRKNTPRSPKRSKSELQNTPQRKKENSIIQITKDNTEYGIKNQTRKMSKEDAELYKLNMYSDATIANKYLNKLDRDSLSRMESGNMRSNERILATIFGKDFCYNQFKSSMRITDELSTYYAEKGKEAMKNLSDMGVMYEPVSSYRTFVSGKTYISWQGTEYVRKK